MAATANLVLRKRITILFLFVVMIMSYILLRLMYIQFIKSGELQKMAFDQRMRPVPVEAKRGAILDRKGTELAVSVSVESMYAIPKEVEEPHKTAEKIAAILGVKKADIYKKITRKQSFVWIQRKVDPDKVRRIKKYTLPGIGFTEESKRVYPKGTLAAHVLGFSGIDSQGLEGIELVYDKFLKGVAGRIIAERDATGREIPQGLKEYLEPKEGNNIYLTIDEVIQYIAERELAKVIEEQGAKSGTIILMDPKTGEILALANQPTYDPNNYADYKENWRNIAISNNYEPGSTFKIVTASAAMEESVVSETEKFYCDGGIKVSSHRIRCHKVQGHGSETFDEVVQNSCNPGFITVGQRLGGDKFYRYIKAFGFGQITNIDLPGEAKGILIPQSQLKPINVATISIGQGIAVTPIQLISAVCAVANDGIYIRPHIVKQIVTPKGKLVKEFKPEKVMQIISKDTARELRSILGDVVRHGTGANASLEGYDIGGKTGTAQKVGPNGGYMQGKYVASFVGLAPTKNPRIVGLIVIDEPTKGMYYGGVIAAPVFREIARDVLRYLEIPPSEENMVAEKTDDLTEPKHELIEVPDLKNLSRNEVSNMLRLIELEPRFEGNDGVVTRQVPQAGVKVKPNTAVIVYLGDKKSNISKDEVVTVPNITGKNVREVGMLLGAVDLKMQISGSGIAVSQRPKAGEKVKAGTTIKVQFSPAD